MEGGTFKAFAFGRMAIDGMLALDSKSLEPAAEEPLAMLRHIIKTLKDTPFKGRASQGKASSASLRSRGKRCS